MVTSMLAVAAWLSTILRHDGLTANSMSAEWSPTLDQVAREFLSTVLEANATEIE